MKNTCALYLTDQQKQLIHNHLFPGDGDEHGAVILAGVATRDGHTRLLGRQIFLAKDGVDYVPGKFGYRMLKAEFIQPLIRMCKRERLAYIAIHNHGGSNQVAFSSDDFDSHERGYPALSDIADGMPVGAAVFAPNACAGDIWFPDGTRRPFTEVRVIGSTIKHLFDKPIDQRGCTTNSGTYDRQLLMFGEQGQAKLAGATVVVIGLGGVGSLLAEYLGRLGIGHIILIDDDRIFLSNLARVVGATYWDARWPFSTTTMPAFVRKLAERYSALKVSIARRMIRQANPKARITIVPKDVSDDAIAKLCRNCDFQFLAADSARARLVANALCQQYFVPGVQVGSKIIPDKAGVGVEQAYSVVRPMVPGNGCLWCNGLIDRTRLAQEAKTEQEIEDQRYGTEQPNPSVITLNAVGAAHAVNDFLFSFLDLRDPETRHHNLRFKHLNRTLAVEQVGQDPSCPECGFGADSRFARGDGVPLPTTRQRDI